MIARASARKRLWLGAAGVALFVATIFTGYALTPKATRRLDDAATRIYRTGTVAWDGRWHLLVLRAPQDRSARARDQNPDAIPRAKARGVCANFCDVAMRSVRPRRWGKNSRHSTNPS